MFCATCAALNSKSSMRSIPALRQKVCRVAAITRDLYGFFVLMHGHACLGQLVQPCIASQHEESLMIEANRLCRVAIGTGIS